MPGMLEGKVTFITRAGRGQGRAHAVMQAAEGAKVIAVDICEDIESNPYPLSSWADLMETKRLVEEAGSQCAEEHHRSQHSHRRRLYDQVAQRTGLACPPGWRVHIEKG
jgi:NAD(P)-dependent dehydrogenase (short-subunit alcohol dehydrogenase family)